MNTRVYLLKYTENKKYGYVYTLLVDKSDDKGNHSYSTLNVGSSWIAKNLANNAGENIRYFRGEIITDGSIKRYMSKPNKEESVILSEIRNKDTNELLGYRLARMYNGGCKIVKEPLSTVLGRCLEFRKHNTYYTSNGVYVPAIIDGGKIAKKAFIKSYKSEGFLIEYIHVVRHNEDANAARINPANRRNIENKSKLTDIFTKDQIMELKLAKNAGVDVRVIANPKLSPKQMRIIWKTEAEKLPGRKFADPKYSVEQMDFYSVELETGGKIDYMLDPRYSVDQLYQLSMAYNQGLDLSQLLNPKLSPEKMSRIIGDLQSATWNKEYYTLLKGNHMN